LGGFNRKKVLSETEPLLSTAVLQRIREIQQLKEEVQRGFFGRVVWRGRPGGIKGKEDGEGKKEGGAL